MRYWLATVLALWVGPASAQDFAPLSGGEIERALRETTLIYDGAFQVFYGSGRTLYDNGPESWGYWRVRAGQYCSQWPPSDSWDCYDMARSGDTLRFIARDGSFTDGVIAR